MTEEPKDNQSQDYQFINEKIVPKKKNRWKKCLFMVVFVVFLAVIFGLVARIVFMISEDYLSELLGIEDQRQQVDLPKPTESGARATISPTPKPTKSPITYEAPTPGGAIPEDITPVPTSGGAIPEDTTPVPTPGGTIPEDITSAPTPSGAIPEDITPIPTPGATVTATPEPSGLPEVTVTPTGTVNNGEGTSISEENPSENSGGQTTEKNRYSYLQMYQEISEVAEGVSAAFVTVEAIEQGVDWFQETYENRTKTTGLILANDGVDLLILVDTEQIYSANSIEVHFGEKIISGRIYSLDKDYGLAVIAVPLNLISKEIYEKIELGVIANASDIQVGTPVIALGAPNGYEDSMEFGMITSLGSTVSVTDGEVAYFTTNITDYPGGYGFVINLDGEIMGMITHTHKQNQKDGIFSAVSLDSIRGLIVKLLNNTNRAYFGIKGQDLPKNLQMENVLMSGVYVSEVENASPALTAGIKAGDVIISVGGEPVVGIRAFTDIILECSPKESVQVKLMRKAEDGMKEITVEVVLTNKK